MTGNQDFSSETAKAAPYPQFTFGGVLMQMVVGEARAFAVTDEEADHADWMISRTHQNSIRRFCLTRPGATVARVERLEDHEKIDGRTLRKGEFDIRMMEIRPGHHIEITASLTAQSAVRKAATRISARHPDRRLVCNLISPGVLRVTRLATGQEGASDDMTGHAVYPFMQLEVGETANVPAPCNISSIRASANYHKRRYLRTFQVRSLEGGRAEIKRVA